MASVSVGTELTTTRHDFGHPKGVEAEQFPSSDSYARVANNLALVYMIEENEENAKPLLQESVNNGNKMAQFNLGILNSTKYMSNQPRVSD